MNCKLFLNTNHPPEIGGSKKLNEFRTNRIEIYLFNYLDGLYNVFGNPLKIENLTV